MSYNDRDYQKIASSIVQDFVVGAIPLADSVVKAAGEMHLNPHETRRLIEATNVNAHLTLFEKQADHKYVEFDIVDPTAVLDTLFAAPTPAAVDPGVKTAHLMFEELPDERWNEVRERIEKTAAAAVPVMEEVPERNKYAGLNGHYAIQTVNRVKEELENELLIRHIDYNDKIAAMHQSMKYLDACTYDQLEKDAFALHDENDVTHPLLRLREMMGIHLEEKTAHDTSAIVLPRREHGILKEAVEAFKAVREVAHGLELYREQAGALFVE
jgi:hypothetical protein